MEYGKCETYGKRLTLPQIWKKRTGYIQLGIPVEQCDLSEEEM